MRFSIFTTLPPCDRTPDQVLKDFREQVVLADQMGFHAVWIGEHHFQPFGGGDLPNPILIGADIAARTERIRIGQMANIAVWWHPIRLAEDLAILDNLTEGRVEAGFGRGIRGYEGPQFHPNAHPHKPENRELFTETIEIVRKAWTQEFFSHEGPNYRFPAEDTRFSHPMYPPNPEWQNGDEVIRLRVTPKPFQKPHPPIWQAADSTSSYEFAARRGHSVIGVARSFEGTREAWTRYREVASEVSGQSLPLGHCANGQTLNIMRTFHIADSCEQAAREARHGINTFFDMATGLNPNWARQAFLAESETLSDEDRNLDWYDFLQKYEILWIGSADFVAERIHKLEEELGCEHVTLWPNPGFVPFEKVLRGMELFAEKVMPQFD